CRPYLVERLDIVANTVGGAFQGGAIHMASRMAESEAGEDTACIGIVDRRSLSCEIRQANQTIGTSRHLSRKRCQSGVGIGPSICFGCHVRLTWLVTEPAREGIATAHGVSDIPRTRKYVSGAPDSVIAHRILRHANKEHGCAVHH